MLALVLPNVLFASAPLLASFGPPRPLQFDQNSFVVMKLSSRARFLYPSEACFYLAPWG